jgi:hypothetical protein
MEVKLKLARVLMISFPDGYQPGKEKRGPGS